MFHSPVLSPAKKNELVPVFVRLIRALHYSRELIIFMSSLSPPFSRPEEIKSRSVLW